MNYEDRSRNLHEIKHLPGCPSLDAEEFFSTVVHKVGSEVMPI